MLALCFAIGIATGWMRSEHSFWPWLIASCVALVVSLVFRRWAGFRLGVICLAVALLGTSWIAFRQYYVASGDLAGWVDEKPILIRARGVAGASPVVRARTAGSMAMFDYRKPATYVPVQLDELVDNNGASTKVKGDVLLRVDETVSPFRAGDRVEATGFLRRFAPPNNPGEFDYQRYARSLGQAGVLTVNDRDLIQSTPSDRGGLGTILLKWREIARRRACAWLLADLPDSASAERDALLSSLLLGRRDRLHADIDDSFRRVGLAHLLAISGLHLGVAVGFIMLVLTWRGHLRRRHGLVMIAVVLLYLFLVEIRMPVLRAGIMMIAAGVGMASGRRWRIRSLVAISGIALLMWRPDQLFTPGFQLSFGVVLGLIQFASPLRRRWFGEPNRDAGSSAQMIGQWVISTSVVAVVAWLIATPITIYHFGLISPIAIILRLVALPLVAAILILGYGKILLALVLPSGALIIGAVLAVIADLLISIVTVADTFPFSVLYVPNPPFIWSVVVLGWVCIGLSGLAARRPAMWWITGAVMVVWLLWPMLPIHKRPLLRIDMLAVGEGTCMILRSGGETIVFDAGSSTNLDAGRKTIIPAMRSLGIMSVDGIVLSHPDLDHYSAATELAEEFDIDKVYVAPQFISTVQHAERGSAVHLMDQLTRLRVAVIELDESSQVPLGDSTATVLQAPRAGTYGHDNNASVVLSIEVAGRTVLLAGDIQSEAINNLMSRHPGLRADVAEFPHHGAYSEEAEALLEQLEPEVLLQSTSYTRWSKDRWGGRLDGVRRLVTARQGACWVEIDDAGDITTGCFVQER